MWWGDLLQEGVWGECKGERSFCTRMCFHNKYDRLVGISSMKFNCGRDEEMYCFGLVTSIAGSGARLSRTCIIGIYTWKSNVSAIFEYNRYFVI